MTPDEVRQIIREELASLLGNDRYIFEKDIEIFDGRNMQTGRTRGTKIATSTDQKIGFYGATPIIQAATIGSPSGGSVIDIQARSAITSIIASIKNLGITA